MSEFVARMGLSVGIAGMTMGGVSAALRILFDAPPWAGAGFGMVAGVVIVIGGWVVACIKAKP